MLLSGYKVINNPDKWASEDFPAKYLYEELKLMIDIRSFVRIIPFQIQSQCEETFSIVGNFCDEKC